MVRKVPQDLKDPKEEMVYKEFLEFKEMLGLQVRWVQVVLLVLLVL
jgi:hypothetical protein